MFVEFIGDDGRPDPGQDRSRQYAVGQRLPPLGVDLAANQIEAALGSHFKGVPQEDRREITIDNAAKLFGRISDKPLSAQLGAYYTGATH
jgi:hypothetical protein